MFFHIPYPTVVDECPAWEVLHSTRDNNVFAFPNILSAELPSRVYLLTTRLDNRDILKVMFHALPQSVFETIRFTWDAKWLKAVSMDKAHSFLGRVVIAREFFEEYDFDRPGELAVFSNRLESILAFALVGRSETTKVTSKWRFSVESLRMTITVESVGQLTHTLQNVPDALPTPSEPRIERSSMFSTETPRLLREIHAATGWAELLDARFSPDGVTFVDPRLKENRFELGGIRATSKAETVLDRASLDFATKILVQLTPLSAEMTIIAGGFAVIKYKFAGATVAYYIPTVVSPE